MDVISLLHATSYDYFCAKTKILTWAVGTKSLHADRIKGYIEVLFLQSWFITCLFRLLHFFFI